MRLLFSAIAVSTLFGASTTARAWVDPSAPPESETSAAVSVDQKADNHEADETWRYRRHQGRWWYWLPSEKWVVWSGDRWVDYDGPEAAGGSSTQSRRSYSFQRPRAGQPSNTGYWDLGRWGPVGYDSYGNRQYPYSRRTRGIRQLGVIPAPGGVRALPGWGGER